jgi:hypothetical protein
VNAFINGLLSTQKSDLIPDEYDYWKDLIGEWEFDYYDGYDKNEKRHVKGEWIFARIMEGIGIQDLFICPSRDTRESSPQPDGEYGVAIRMFNPKTLVWDMVYTHRGRMTRLEGTKEEGKVVLTMLDNPASKWVFAEISKEKFHWQNITVLKDGSWKINSDVYAVKKK